MKVLAVILILFCFQQAFAQGEFVERGKNAYCIGVSISGFEKYTAVGLNAGCSFDGTLDLSLTYSLFTNTDSKSTDGTSSTAISPNVAIHIIKQNSIIPFALSVYALYQRQSTTINSTDLTSNVHSWSIGGELNHFFSVSPSFGVQPGLLFAFSDILNVEYRSTDSGVYTTGVSIANILNVENNLIVFEPVVAFGNSETTFSFAIYFVGILSNGDEL